MRNYRADININVPFTSGDLQSIDNWLNFCASENNIAEIPEQNVVVSHG